MYIRNTETKNFEKTSKGFFGALVCCKCLMPDLEASEFFAELEQFIYNAEIMKSEKMRSILLNEMGMPENWTDIIAVG